MSVDESDSELPYNHQLKEGAQEEAPKVDLVPERFCISHSVELAILKPPRFIAS